MGVALTVLHVHISPNKRNKMTSTFLCFVPTKLVLKFLCLAQRDVAKLKTASLAT